MPHERFDSFHEMAAGLETDEDGDDPRSIGDDADGAERRLDHRRAGVEEERVVEQPRVGADLLQGRRGVVLVAGHIPTHGAVGSLVRQAEERGVRP